MESIISHFKNLDINETTDYNQVGFVYHPDTLLHAVHEQDFDKKSEPHHSENPIRLMSIIEHLN